jgi:hypothetical protein
MARPPRALARIPAPLPGRRAAGPVSVTAHAGPGVGLRAVRMKLWIPLAILPVVYAIAAFRDVSGVLWVAAASTAWMAAYTYRNSNRLP